VKVVELERVLGPDWLRYDFSGLGEIDLRVMLRQWGGQEVAEKLAPAWRGGYYMALTNKKSPEDAPLPLALVLSFTSPAAANEFAALYQTELPQRYKSVQPATAPHQWMTEEGEVHLYVDGSTVIALESFSSADAAKIHDALVPAVKKPFEISPPASTPAPPV
jgi:hypothetical protein